VSTNGTLFWGAGPGSFAKRERGAEWHKDGGGKRTDKKADPESAGT